LTIAARSVFSRFANSAAPYFSDPAFCFFFPLSGGPEGGGLAACAVRARHPSTKYPIVLPGEFTSGPNARRISRRCGAAFFAHFLSLQKESESGFGSEAPDPVVGNRCRLEARGIDRGGDKLRKLNN